MYPPTTNHLSLYICIYIYILVLSDPRLVVEYIWVLVMCVLDPL